jgi:hypothetical protein
MSRACPKRGQYKKPQNDGPCQMMAVQTTEPKNVSGDLKSLRQQIRGLTPGEKESLIDSLISDPDF